MNGGQLVALVAAVVLGASCYAPSLRGRGRAALPLRIHNAAWAVALVLYGLPLIDYVAPSPRAWLLLYGGILSFNVGATVCLSRIDVLPTDRIAGPHRSRLLEWGLPLLFFVGVVLYLGAVAKVFGLRELLTSPGTVRSQQDNPAFLAAYTVPSRILYGLGPLCLMTYALPSVSGIRPRPVQRSFVLIVCFVGMAMSLGRSLLLVSIVWTVMAAVLSPSRKRVAARVATWRRHRRRIAIAGVVAGLALFQFGAVVLGKTGESNPAVQDHVSPLLQGSVVTSVVVYLTGGIPSFALLVDDGPANPLRASDDGPFLGSVVVTPLSKVLGWAIPDEVRPFTRNPIPHNAYTYLDAFWLDFREPGVVLLPVLFGFGLTLLLAKRSRSREGMMARAILAGLLLWVPFSFTFGSTYTWASLGFLGVVLQARRIGAASGRGEAPDRGPGPAPVRGNAAIGERLVARP